MGGQPVAARICKRDNVGTRWRRIVSFILRPVWWWWWWGDEV